jgi:gluconate 2-dehydrogenase gamma chain
MPEALLFLNRHEAATLDMLAGHIVPGDADDPGAREAGAVTYVDRALAGFLRELQTFYREGLRALDRHGVERFGERFAALDEAHQRQLLEELEEPLSHVFAVIREHVVQAFLCDPAHGGNRDAVGWKLIGFPGAQWGYGAEHMARHYDATAMPVAVLADLYEEAS